MTGATTASPRLTIAIPTYNFGAFIGETLASVTAGLPAGVELLVVDGASTDDTGQVVADFAARTPQLRYHRLPVKGGIDADIAIAISLAAGEHVWLLSADDVVMPGGVARVLALIASRPDVLLVAHSDCTLDMRTITPRHPIVRGTGGDFHVKDAAARRAYFRAAATTEALFSFCSGLVLRRAAWDAAPVAPDFFHGSCWAHAARLLAAMRANGMMVKVEVDPLVARRGDNDSFRGGGVVKRYAIALEGYPAIVAAVFGEGSVEVEEARRVLRAEFGLRAFLLAKLALVDGVDDAARLRRMIDAIQPRTPAGLARRIAYRAAPRAGLVLLRRGVRAARRGAGR